MQTCRNPYDPKGAIFVAKWNVMSSLQSKRVAYEPLTFCCDNGKIRLASNQVSDYLVDLLTCKDKEGEHFRIYARLYNTFCFDFY